MLEKERFYSRNDSERRALEVLDFRDRPGSPLLWGNLNALCVFDQRWESTGVPVVVVAVPRTGRPSSLAEGMSLAIISRRSSAK
ncbi:MAG: hypothetical protein OXN89_19140 [Bryobacterales bacterium]|nr:hypothetical protein [Bryobacterales bacterium]